MYVTGPVPMSGLCACMGGGGVVCRAPPLCPVASSVICSAPHIHSISPFPVILLFHASQEALSLSTHCTCSHFTAQMHSDKHKSDCGRWLEKECMSSDCDLPHR